MKMYFSLTLLLCTCTPISTQSILHAHNTTDVPARITYSTFQGEHHTVDLVPQFTQEIEDTKQISSLQYTIPMYLGYTHFNPGKPKPRNDNTGPTSDDSPMHPEADYHTIGPSVRFHPYPNVPKPLNPYPDMPQLHTPYHRPVIKSVHRSEFEGYTSACITLYKRPVLETGESQYTHTVTEIVPHQNHMNT